MDLGQFKQSISSALFEFSQAPKPLNDPFTPRLWEPAVGTALVLGVLIAQQTPEN